MVVVSLGAIERAELAVNVADVGVIDVAIDDVSHDLAAAVIVARGLCQVAPRRRQLAQFRQRPAIKLERFRGRDSFSSEDFFCQRFFR